MKFNIALIKGDGIGPEISAEAVKVLEESGRIFSHNFNITYVVAAGEAVDKFNNPLPEESIETCIKSDARVHNWIEQGKPHRIYKGCSLHA